MKKLSSLLLVAIFAGAITLGAYKLFFEHQNFAIIAGDSETKTFNTNFTPTSPKGAGINEVDFTIAAENTVNAVVHVKNMTLSSGGPTSLRDLFYGYGGSQRAQIGTGSGVIISSDGYIVTNNHVIAGATKLQVTLNNNRDYDAEVVGADANTDIALLKIDAEDKLPYLAFGDSDNTKIGEWVLAVGNPFNLTSTVTAGIVSAKARDLDMGRNQSFIQTDAAVNPGNSGGALVNTNGDLVGINTAISSQTGSYVGYSFAVPSNIAKKVVDDILEYGNVKKGYLGISAVNTKSREAFENGINETSGVYVGSVEDGLGADEAGIVPGDIIKKVDNIKIRKFPDLTGYLSTKRPGDEVSVTIERDGKNKILAVVLKERKSLTVPVMGLEVKNLTEKERRLFNTQKGVRVVDVPERYKGYGLEGKVIIEIDGEDINTIEDADKLFRRLSGNGRNSITLLDENGERERLIFQ